MLFKEFIADQKILDNGYKNEKPLISIVMPTFCRNKEGRLEECLQSVFNQDFKNFEYIIIDDGSSDGSQDVITRYAQKDPRIVYVRHDINSGLPAIRTNEGVLLARGEYVAFMFDDNIWTPQTLSKLLARIEKNDADVVFSNTEVFTSETNSFLLGQFPLTEEFLSHLNTIPNGSVICRKDFFQTYGLYDPHLMIRRICDWDLWLRAFKLGARLVHLNEALSKEYGPASPVSIGSSVKWDYKVAHSYMTDENIMKDRTSRLKYPALLDFNVFETETILPYVKNDSECAEHFKIVYEPFFVTHPDYPKPSFKISNRFFDQYNPENKKRRYLLVSNTANPLLLLWKKTILENTPHLADNCSDWQLTQYSEQEVDAIILFDSVTEFMKPELARFKNNNVPVLYVNFYGENNPATSSAMDYNKNPDIYTIFKMDMYFPKLGVPWNNAQKNSASSIMKDSDFVLVPQNSIFTKDFSCSEYKPEQIQSSDFILSCLQVLELKRFAPGLGAWGIFLNSELLSGSEAYGVQIAEILKNLKLSVKIFIPEKNVYGNEYNSKELSRLANSKGLDALIPAPYRPFAAPQDVGDTTALQAFIKEQNLSGVFCSGFMPEVLVAAKSSQRPAFASLFQPSGYNLNNIALMQNYFDGVITDSNWSLQTWKHLTSNHNARVPTYAHDGLYTRTLPDRIRIAIGGTLQPRKRQLDMVKAAVRLIKDDKINIELNVYGYALNSILGEYINSIKKEISDNNLNDRIRLHNMVPMDELIANNDMIVSASLDESLPQTMLYSMAQGVIGVGSLSGGLDELIVDGKTGYLTKSAEPEELYNVVKRALNDKSKWPQIRDNTRKHIQENFSLNKATREMVKVLEGGLATFGLKSKAVTKAWTLLSATTPSTTALAELPISKPNVFQVALNYRRTYGFKALARKVYYRLKN